MIDYYKVLELSASATPEQIKKAYRRIALKYHPDKNNGDKTSEQRFKEIVEAYETLSNIDKREKYDSNYASGTKATNSAQEQKKSEPLTPITFLAFFRDLRKKISGIDKKRINQRNLFDTINDLLVDDNVTFLINFGDFSTNSLIIEEILECCKPLGYEKHPLKLFIYVDRIIPQLIKLAGRDKVALKKIQTFNKWHKLVRFFDKYDRVLISAALILFFIVAYNLGGERSSSTSNSPVNGDLNNTFNATESTPQISPEQEFQEQKDSLLSSGWEEQFIDNGQLSSCYNFTPKRGKIDNYLEIVVGASTDVAIKVMNLKTEECIRYVFINSGSTYKIRNIPQGQYYLKIAYGKDWFSKVIDGQCIGKFIRNPLYEKGEDILDYNIQKHSDGNTVPSFRLSLDVISTNTSNSFNSANISADDFNR